MSQLSNVIKGIVIGAITGVSAEYLNTPFSLPENTIENKLITKENSLESVTLPEKNKTKLAFVPTAITAISIRESYELQTSILESIEKSKKEEEEKARVNAIQELAKEVKVETPKTGNQPTSSNSQPTLENDEKAAKIEPVKTITEDSTKSKSVPKEKETDTTSIPMNLSNTTQLAVTLYKDSDPYTEIEVKDNLDFANNAILRLTDVKLNNIEIERKKNEEEKLRLKKEADLKKREIEELTKKVERMNRAQQEKVKISKAPSAQPVTETTLKAAPAVKPASAPEVKKDDVVSKIYDVLLSYDLDTKEKHLTAPSVKKMIQDVIDTSNKFSFKEDGVKVYMPSFEYKDLDQRDMVLVYYSKEVSNSEKLFEKYKSASDTLIEAVKQASHRTIEVRLLPSY